MVNGSWKGSAFERKIAVKLSLWVTDRTNPDVLWRSAGSGARATGRYRRKGGKKRILESCIGDLSAVHPDGAPFLQLFLVELKHYKDLGHDRFIFGRTGQVDRFWAKVKDEGVKYGRMPMMIWKMNSYPEACVVDAAGARLIHQASTSVPVIPTAISPRTDSFVYSLQDVVSRTSFSKLLEASRGQQRSQLPRDQ